MLSGYGVGLSSFFICLSGAKENNVLLNELERLIFCFVSRRA